MALPPNWFFNAISFRLSSVKPTYGQRENAKVNRVFGETEEKITFGP